MALHEAWQPGLILPDLILTNGRVLTMDRADTVAEAVAIKGDRILAIGSTSEIEALAGASTERVDLRGRTALPGLADVHVHLASDATRKGDAVEARDFYIPSIRSISDIQEEISARTAHTPPGNWLTVLGSPMQDFRLAEQRLPTRHDLDAAAPDHPTYMTFGAHSTVANTLALKLKGVTRDTPSPQGGTVVMDPETGEPTGLLRERAQYLVKSQDAGMSPEALAESILAQLQTCAARGVTTVHDIVINRDEVRAYQLLERSGRLPVRVQIVPRVIESSFAKESLLDLGILHGFGSDWLRVGGIKMSIDGGFTGKNAAFSEPLALAGEENPGLIRIKQDELDDTVWRYHEMGMRCCVHAIGDVALEMVLESFEKAIDRLPRQDHRHRVEHLGNWMMTPERIERTRRLGILPIANPSFLHFLGQEILDSLGPKRTEGAFPFRTLLDRGFPLAWGSDAPGYWPIDPLRDIGTVVSRSSFRGLELAPEEKITMREALRAQTVNAAYTGFQEAKLGSLEPGKLADVAVLAEDPFVFPPDQFRDLPVNLTITGGRIVHGRE
ncbi:MAG TPA: amidohydrolase [Chloroflexota bacterium]|nr:amidohydrolase [Chloroflexota bacterium]